MHTTESVHSREHKADLVYNKGETEVEWDRGEKRALTPCHQWQKDTQRFGCEQLLPPLLGGPKTH